QGQVLAAVGPGAGHDYVFLPARRGVAAGFPERPGGIPHRATVLRELGWFLFDGRCSTQYGGGPGGDAMKNRGFESIAGAALCLALACSLASCGENKADPKAEAPPAATVEPDLDANNFKVDHPEQFPLVKAIEHKAAPALNVTGGVQPDIARAVPVISLAAGRVVEIKARLGDTVKKGQLLLRVQSNDVSGAYQTYRKAVNDELLARQQLERQQLLYDKGAIAKSALEQAVDGAENADIHLNAYPNKVFKARVDNILPVLDPSLRTAKVRLEVANPGMMRVGMFVTATFYGKQPETHAAVP